AIGTAGRRVLPFGRGIGVVEWNRHAHIRTRRYDGSPKIIDVGLGEIIPRLRIGQRAETLMAGGVELHHVDIHPARNAAAEGDPVCVIAHAERFERSIETSVALTPRRL